jgi:hypothetical protein
MSTNCTLFVLDSENGDIDPDEAALELHRNFDILNFVLAGTSEPDDPIAGFISIEIAKFNDEQSLEAMPLVEAEKVRAIGKWLSENSDENFLSHFDPQVMADAHVYDYEFAVEMPDDCKTTILEMLASLREFIKLAIAKNRCISVMLW